MTVKVSVIIPVYNAEEFLEKSLNSVLNQSLKDIEIICINDGSTDNSLNILEEYSKKYNLIIMNQKNSGSGIARNEGIKVSKGKYVSFLDSDDFYIDKDSLFEMFILAEKLDSNMLSANLKTVKKGKLVESSYCINREEKCTILPEEYGIPWYFYKSIFKREFLLENDIWFPNYLRGQDPVFLAEIFTKIDHIDYIPIDFYAYRYILNTKTKYNTKQKKIDYISHFIDVFRILNNPKFYKMYSEYEYHLKRFLKREITDEEKDYILEACENDIFIFKMFENNLDLINKENEIKRLNKHISKRNREIRKLKKINKDLKSRKIDKLVNVVKSRIRK